MDVKKMNTQEAIEFISAFKKYADNNRDVPMLISDGEKFKEIISLLQQGEKYRQMWESYRRDVIECSDTKTYYNIILPLEQKYFPKEAKQDKADEQVEN